MIVNLTPHDIVVQLPDGKRVVFPPSGIVARVDVKQERLPFEINGIPVVRNAYGEVKNLPEHTPGTIYIVSGLVLSRCKGRKDVFAPDTGPTAIRDQAGNIVAATRLVAADLE